VLSEKGSGETSPDQMNEVLTLVELRQRMFFNQVSRNLIGTNDIEPLLEIRIHILSGRVDEATNLLNEHFPFVLSEAGPHPPVPQKPTPRRFDAVVPTSVDATHLSLNLRILAFTEASRTVPLEYNPHPKQDDGVISSVSHLKSVHSSPKSPIYDQEDPEAKQMELLCMAQKLYSVASQLQDPKARAQYLGELGLVGGLLAYKIPENSPMAKYLSQERREAVADQINGAILCTLVEFSYLSIYLSIYLT
jgi:hypothetical protein